MGPQIPLFWTSGAVSSGFQSQSGPALFELGRGVPVTCSLRFTSDVTPADLLAASMAAEPSLPHTCEALVGLKTKSYHAAVHSVRSGRPDALPTELSRLGKSMTFEFFLNALSEFAEFSDKNILFKKDYSNLQRRV